MGNGSVLWGGYVTGCHWVSDLELNSCSSGIMCFHWRPLIWKYKPKTNRDIEHWSCFYVEVVHFSLKVKNWATFMSHMWLITVAPRESQSCINMTNKHKSILHTVHRTCFFWWLIQDVLSRYGNIIDYSCRNACKWVFIISVIEFVKKWW